MAYDISISDVQIGTSKLVFYGLPISRLVKSDGPRLCKTSIEQSPHGGLLGDALRAEMISQNLDSIALAIRYRGKSEKP